MGLDIGPLERGDDLEADVCVIGAGPAGMVVARDLAVAGLGVLVLESGGSALDQRAQRLSEGVVVGHRYAGLAATRRRQVGGTARAWNTPVAGVPGAKYAPLSPADLAPARAAPLPGWPVPWDELERWYLLAQRTCGLGPFVYDGDAWADASNPLLSLASSALTTRVYQLGAARRVTDDLLDALAERGTARVRHGATASRVVTRSGRPALVEVTASGGARMQVRARVVVLAGGAVENARLLLLSGLGASSGWLGRCFMEHPRDHALTLLPAPGLLDRLGFYDVHEAPDSTPIAGRIALTDSALEDVQLPNASLTLVPRPRRRSRAALGQDWLPARYPPARQGWTRAADPSATVDALHLLLNVEQAPDPANRILLSRRRDPYGVPQAELHWRWTRRDAERLARLRDLVSRALEDGGAGTVVARRRARIEPSAHHHAGTTRMAGDPADGVVDPDGRVHGTEDVYVTGASLLPTAGFANPTLTIVALAHRLAHHLASRG